jgi:pimeloyl-ACP methyl ester carboxylesterase
VASEVPSVPGVEHRFVQAGAIRMHVAEAGAGEPVLLLHGWPQHWYCWRRVIPLLAEHHRVLCPDLRGFGWSDAPASSYAKQELASDVLALLDALELERVRLVGHDWGGFVAFLAALRAPERVSGLLALAIIHPWARPLRPGPSLARRLTRLPAYAYQPILAAPILGPLVPRLAPLDAVFASSRIWSAEERAAFVRVLREPARAEASSRLYRTFLLRELPAMTLGRYVSGRLEVPARLVVGRRDPVITEDLVDGYQQHADDMTVEVVDGGHFLPEQRPEVVADRVLAMVGR